MTKQVECFGCDVDPFSSNQQTVKMVENKYTQQIFKDASIEIKLNAKRIFSPDEKAWSWKDIINLQNEKAFSSEVQREIEELILANNFLGYVSEGDDQNALVCLQSVENECQKVVAMVHDVGASLGNRNEYSGGSRPRGDIKSYNRATIFKSNGFQCVYNLSTFRGTLPPNDLSEEAKKSFLMRAERLTQTELFTIFENSHLMNLNSKGTPQAWAKSIRDKIDEIKIGCRNNYF